MLNLINFLKCNKSNTRISIIRDCVENINIFKLEDCVKFEKKEISDIIVYPENVRVIEEKNMKINFSCTKQLLHSIAHIEYNAQSIYVDTILRFFDEFQDKSTKFEFIKDLVNIANEETFHFHLLESRLKELDSYFGMFDVHNKLWRNSFNTKDNLLARLAVISLVQEPRGLDAGPRLINKLKSMGDEKSANLVKKIIEDEVNHVKTGMKWFKIVCNIKGITNYEDAFRKICDIYLTSPLFPPFNEELRNKADLPESWYKARNNKI